MRHPRSRRSGQHLHGDSSDLLPVPPSADPAGGDGTGSSPLPPVTHNPTSPGIDRMPRKGHGAIPAAPVGAARSHLHQEGHLEGYFGVTVMPFATEISSGVSLSHTPLSSTPQLPTPPTGALRSVEEASPLSRPLNYTLQTKGDTEDAHEHPLLASPPPATPFQAVSPSPHYLTAIHVLHHDRDEASPTHPDLEEENTQLTHTPEGGEEGTNTTTDTTTTTTTTDEMRNRALPLPHTTTNTTTTTDEMRNRALPLPHTTTTTTTTITTRRSKRPTREPRRWTGRTQRSAPSQKRSNSYSVCFNDPCGKEPSCHPNKNLTRGFDCFCDGGEKIEPGQKCPSRGKVLTIHPSPKTLTTHKEPVNMVVAMGVASVLLVAVLLLVFWRRKSLCAWMRHRHREKKPSQQSQDTLPKSNSLVAYNFASNPNYYTQGPDTQTVHTLPVHLIHPEQISFIGELGEGCFGKVYKGTYTSRCPDTITEGDAEGEQGGVVEGVVVGGEDEEIVTQTVAVKVIKESVSAKGEEDFMREVEIMSAFSHPNILTLIGIVAKGIGGTPWMVFEFMPYGDLAELLRSCGPHFYSNHTPVTSLSKSDLLHISVQIASGMEYLSSQHFVHRDLACRNCLVGENLTVKISDFGMSRDVYTCDYYKVGGSRMLPVRWMAPESIMYGKFTLESDVWSFGVVLWEIYSFGKQPYYGNSNENVVKLIFQGILLSPPDTCPPQVCDVMRRCWATDPTDRLKFPEILAHLKGLRGEGKGVSPHDTSLHPAVSPCGPPVTYSQLCMQEEATGHLDQDLYLMPRRVEPREYLTVLNDPV